MCLAGRADGVVHHAEAVIRRPVGEVGGCTGHAAIAVTATMTRIAQPAVVIALLISAWRERHSR